MSEYPAADRQSCGFAIRFIKALMSSDAIRDVGIAPVMLVTFIASREDRLHYKGAPRFWRAELMDRMGYRSPKDFIRTRDAAVDAGLLHHAEGTRTQPGQYWCMVPDWLQSEFEAFPKRNGKRAETFPKRNESTATRSQKGIGKGTAKGTAKGTLSNTHIPIYP